MDTALCHAHTSHTLEMTLTGICLLHAGGLGAATEEPGVVFRRKQIVSHWQ